MTDERTPFSEMNIPPRLLSAIDAMGYTEPTEIQARAIPLIRTGRDLIGRSQTGTGKTVAFAVPALERIDPELEAVQVLILCPTRELAQQGCEEIKKLSRFMMHIYPVDVYGGAAMTRQIQRLRRANLVIGTPGRVMDHMRRHTLRLDQVRMVVLDEADEMLSMGFREDMETILNEVPAERQTVLFSATMPPEIEAISAQYLRDPQRIEAARAEVPLDAIAQRYVEVPMGRKLDALCLLLRTEAAQRAMVFCNTKSMVDEVAAHLMRNGFAADGLHGDLVQSQRTKVMDAFKLGRLNVLVATDVAARGIDVSGVDYVFNYDVPQDPEYYIHRIGRTGRAGRTGVAITLCSGRRQVQALMQLARETKSAPVRTALPTISDAAASLLDRISADISGALAEPVPECAYEWVRTLQDRGLSPTEIAAAALHLQYGDAVARPEEAFSTGAAKSGEFRRIRLNIGRSSRVAPNHLVGAIAERTGIAGSEIGKIEIYDDASVVGIPAEMAEDCAALMGGCRICGKPVTCELVDDAAISSRAPRRAGKAARGHSAPREKSARGKSANLKVPRKGTHGAYSGKKGDGRRKR